MELFLIDGIGPFFRNYRKYSINWSKIPFSLFDTDPATRDQLFAEIRTDLDTFCQAARTIGYNSVSLDDVAHLVGDRWLEPEVNDSIHFFATEFRKLFAICSRHQLDVFMTMDILSMTPELAAYIGQSRKRARQFLLRQLRSLLTDFPEISGVILRIGECDGQDVKGTFRSTLLLKTARQVNQLLKELLPVFEHCNRKLILRNWTVGAYKVGDFLWHRATTARVLKGINSPNFVLSMKYGESDFFRYLPLNRHFFRLPVNKIIELQARREYEGCGEYPSFIGWDYEAYARELQTAENMIGISVWCQTGGWVPFRRLTFLEPEAVWNEINTHVSLQIFKDNCSTEEAINRYVKTHPHLRVDQFTRLLQLSDEVIKELLYIEELACQKLYFRRVRIPPLLSVFWNNILINHPLRKILRHLVDDGETAVIQGRQALDKIDEMQALAADLQLPADDIEFMKDTFAVLALAREYYFMPYDDGIRMRIKAAKRAYKKKYPKELRPRYRIKTDFSSTPLPSHHLGWLVRLLVRRRRGYRMIDHLLVLHFLALIYRLITRRKPKLVPKFARKSAMGIGTLFR